jgi:antitoxin component YwqK of YwqJK toxin-antitoxin module
MIGSYGGPIGAAAGATAMLVYSAVTGNVPFQGPSHGHHGGGGGGGGGGYSPNGPASPDEADREQSMDEQINGALAKQDELQQQIQDELKRQEELLSKIDKDQKSDRAATLPKDPGKAQKTLEEADPRVAPSAPQDREIPAALFTESRVTIPKGAWGDNPKLEVIKKTLDADRDGKPEEIRYFDATTGQILRKEEDRNYDGTIDAWTTYQNGVVVARELDENGDGKPDVWEKYANGRMTRREVDRKGDGKPDAFYIFEGDSLIEERHDTQHTGKIDLVIYYQNRKRLRSEEDQNHDGRIDTWTYYAVGDAGTEVVTRIERDTKGRGKPDTFETFAQQSGKTVIVKREEDTNGDGKIDVTSYYENGKLVRREVADPALTPL